MCVYLFKIRETLCHKVPVKIKIYDSIDEIILEYMMTTNDNDDDDDEKSKKK